MCVTIVSCVYLLISSCLYFPLVIVLGAVISFGTWWECLREMVLRWVHKPVFISFILRFCICIIIWIFDPPPPLYTEFALGDRAEGGVEYFSFQGSPAGLTWCFSWACFLSSLGPFVCISLKNFSLLTEATAGDAECMANCCLGASKS